MDGHMMRSSAHRLTQKRAYHQRRGGQCLLELEPGAQFSHLSAGSPQTIPLNGGRRHAQ
jgi:hypothetical protein